jgi:flagellin-like protein
MKTKKGISPILATVILIAVTLVIAVGVIGWVMGIWGSMGRTEMLSVTPIKLSSTDNKLELLIINQGQIKATIKNITVEGLGACDDNISPTNVIQPGDSTTITCTISGTQVAVAGVVYTVKVITSSGNIYQTQVRAE